MKVLVLCDDYWHPAEVIEKGLELLQKRKEGREFEFDFVKDAKDILTPEFIREYPVIINAKGNALIAANQNPWFEDGVTEVGPGELKAYVEAGGGFISLHSGNSFRADQCREYTDFVGNSFVGHPRRCDIQMKVVKEHPITADVEDFVVRDEHYAIDHLAEDRDEFMTSRSESGGTQSAGYTRQIGAGRLCVLTPGHILSVFQNEQYQKMLCNAIRWCAGK